MVIQAGYGGASYVQWYRLDVVVHTCNPSPGEVETGGRLGLTGQPEWPNWQASGQLRDPVSRNKVNGA